MFDTNMPLGPEYTSAKVQVYMETPSYLITDASLCKPSWADFFKIERQQERQFISR